MIFDSDGCSECSEDEEEIAISKSRLTHMSKSVNLGKLLPNPLPKSPIEIDIPLGEMVNPNETIETCVNPACSEWQDDIEELLRNINDDLEIVAQTGDWTHINRENIEYLSQLGEGALDWIDEQGIEWQDVEKQIGWKKIEDNIDNFEENFEPAAEYTVALHNLRGAPNPAIGEHLPSLRESPTPGIGKLPKSANALDNLTELRDRIETEVAADVETAPTDNGEEEEQGPIEEIESEIETLKAEKEERIEERKEGRETKIGELKSEVEELKEEQQEKIGKLKDEKGAQIGKRKAEIDELKAERENRINWREEEIEELSEEKEEQIEELQEQIREIRKQKENQIDTRREQIAETRTEHDEQITETREKYDKQIEEIRERITEIRTEYDEQITEIRDEYEDRIDTRRDRLTELREQDTDRALDDSPGRDTDPTERDGDGEERGAVAAAGSGDGPAPDTATTGSPTDERTSAGPPSGGTDGESATGSAADATDATQANEHTDDSLSKGERWLLNPDAEKPDPKPEQYERLNGEPLPEELRNGNTENDSPDREDDRPERDDAGQSGRGR